MSQPNEPNNTTLHVQTCNRKYIQLKMLKPVICVTLLFVMDFVFCKPDYIFNNEANGWLKLHAIPATWHEAFLNCHYEGAVLASPVSSNLASALRFIMKQSNMDSSIFLGVNAFPPGNFISIEGVPLSDLSIIWGTYGQGETPEDCLTLSTKGKTYISSCKLSLPYICYRKRDKTTILNQCGTFDNEYKLLNATGSCYKHHKKPGRWVTAHKICAAEGAHLLIINDQKEADAVQKAYLDPPSYGNWGGAAYIGLRDWIGDNTWLSIHGEKIDNLFNKWAIDQPDLKGGCGLFWGQRTLEDVACDDQNALYSFICEKDPHSPRFENITILSDKHLLN